MVRRIVALLLIGAWQLQAAVPPHVHAGMSADELIAHGAHRHVHLAHDSHESHDHAHRHAHHEHAHGDHDHGHSQRHAVPANDHLEADLAAPPADHDDDAIYLDAGSEATVTRTSPHVVPQGVATNVASACNRTASLERHTSAPPRYGGQVPAFLGITRLLL